MKRPTHDEFMTAWHVFHDIMCSAATTTEKIDAWGALLHVYFLCEGDLQVTHDDHTYNQEDNRKAAMDMLMVEFPLRLGLEAGIEIENVFNAGRIAAAIGDVEALDYMFGSKPIDVGSPGDKTQMNGGSDSGN